MADIEKEMGALLRTVEKPSRYIGGEWNSFRKDPASVRLKFALCFPDIYEVGMSHLGFKILYALLNSRREILAERFFMPWVDLQKLMREMRIPLFSLENRIPLKNFDIVGFSLQYELNYTNLLAMLDLGGIPLHSHDRDEESSLVIAGGPAVFNPEPLSEFIDLFLVGDGEESLTEFCDLFLSMREEGAPRSEIIKAAPQIQGVYAPALYGTCERKGFIIPDRKDPHPYPVRRRILMNIDAFPFPESVIVPHCEIVHDRVSFEIMRGCHTGCRFCQAGYIYRPKRERDPGRVRDAVKRSIVSTGYDEASLASLNSGEYSGISFLLSSLMESFAASATSLSLPSLKPSSLTEGVVREIKKVRKTGFTIAPEAATERLRAVINKNITEEHILNAAGTAFAAGWRLLKLYFMIGLPTETDDDLGGIVDLVKNLLRRIKEVSGRRGRINVSLASFVPKPHTPFQWLPMADSSELEKKQAFIKSTLSSDSIRIKWHSTKMSYLEAVLSRGDRKLGDIIEKAYRLGCSFDGWTDRFDYAAWMQAFESSGLDPSVYAYRTIDPDNALPWDIIDTGIGKDFLRRELARALRAERTPVCGPEICHGCASFARECMQIMSTRYLEPREGSSPREEIVHETGHDQEYRYRALYEKTGMMRYLSHLDVARTVIRGMRRAQIPLVHSKGFNPMPKVSFGPALPLGIESKSEYLDFCSHDYVDAEAFPELLNSFLPAGITFRKCVALPLRGPSLSESINLALYSIQYEPSAESARFTQAIKELNFLKMSAGEESEPVLWSRETAGAVKNLHSDGRGTVKLFLYIAGSRKAKISDILKILLGDDYLQARVVREELLIDRAGRAASPLLVVDSGREYVKRDDH